MIESASYSIEQDVPTEQSADSDRFSQQDTSSVVQRDSPHHQKLNFSMDKLTDTSSQTVDGDIIERLEAFTKKYEQMILDVCAASKVVECCSQYAESQLRSAIFLQCRRKVHNMHQAMNSIDLKVMAIQQKLNNIRKHLPPRQHSLVETGPFYYKCVYPGGVRYRDYPSSTARVVSDDAVVTHNQIIEIAERVFIAAEHSVYLHNKGVGWLFENKKDIICFVRVSSVS